MEPKNAEKRKNCRFSEKNVKTRDSKRLDRTDPCNSRPILTLKLDLPSFSHIESVPGDPVLVVYCQFISYSPFLSFDILAGNFVVS